MKEGDFLTIDNIIQLFNTNDRLYVVDCYPFVVLDNKKFSQIEHTKKRNSKMLKYKSRHEEDLIINFFETIWLYSKTKAYLFDYKKNIMNQISYVKIKKHFRFNEFFEIDQINNINEIFKPIFKEYSSAYFVFENFRNKGNIYMYLDGTTGLIVVEDPEQENDINIIATNCHLFVRKQINKTGDGSMIDSE